MWGGGARNTLWCDTESLRVCICICMYVHLYIHTYIYVYMYIYIYIFINIQRACSDTIWGKNITNKINDTKSNCVNEIRSRTDTRCVVCVCVWVCVRVCVCVRERELICDGRSRSNWQRQRHIHTSIHIYIHLYACIYIKLSVTAWTWQASPPYAWHDSLTCVTWLIHMMRPAHKIGATHCSH